MSGRRAFARSVLLAAAGLTLSGCVAAAAAVPLLAGGGIATSEAMKDRRLPSDVAVPRPPFDRPPMETPPDDRSDDANEEPADEPEGRS